jgi:hypothetical protein
MIMRGLRKFWGLGFKRCNRTAQKGSACHPSYIEACPCEHFADKPKQRFPDKGWRLLTRISCASSTAEPKDTYNSEIDEDVLERIDFFACLFGNRKIE